MLKWRGGFFYSRDVITSIIVEHGKKHRVLWAGMLLDCARFFFLPMNLIAEFPGNLYFIADADVPIASTKLNTPFPTLVSWNFHVHFDRCLLTNIIRHLKISQRVYKHIFFKIQTNLVSFKSTSEINYHGGHSGHT